MAKEGEVQEIELDGEISLANLEAVLTGKPIVELPEDDIEEDIEGTVKEKVAEKPKGKQTFVGATEDIEDDDEDEGGEEVKAGVKPVENVTPAKGEPTAIYKKAQLLIEEGFLDDIRVAVSDEDEEGTPLSEFSDLTEEHLTQIIEAQKTKIQEERDSNYISKENLSEHHLKIIDIMKNGEDIQELFKDPNEILKRPFEEYNLDEEDNQKRVILHYYMNDKGLSQKEAIIQLQQKEKDLEVDTFSNQIVTAYNKAYDKYLEDTSNTKAEEAKAKRDDIAARRRDFTAKLKEDKLKESVVKKLVDGATKVVEGDLVRAEQRLQEILKDPANNHEVLMHLLDEESFKELYKIKSSKKTTSEILRIVDSLPKTTTKREKKVDDDGLENLSPFEKELESLVIKQ